MKHVDLTFSDIDALPEQELDHVIKQLVASNLVASRSKVLAGGVTNKLYLIETEYEDTSTGPSLVLRIDGYNTDIIVDRESGNLLHSILHSKGVGSRLYGTFRDGAVYEFIPGETMSIDDASVDPAMSSFCKEVARWHRLTISHPDVSISPKLWINLNKWVHLTEDIRCEDKRKQESLESFDLALCRREAKVLEDFLVNKYGMGPSKHVTFCHNDLITRNAIFQCDIGRVQFIDFEYAGYNYRGFDIGNHFCEYTTLDILLERYPSKAQQYKFIEMYLRSMTDCHPSKDDIHDLYVEANHFALASHLMWAVWGVLQHCNSLLDFDYIKYAHARFDAYLEWKDRIMRMT